MLLHMKLRFLNNRIRDLREASDNRLDRSNLIDVVNLEYAEPNPSCKFQTSNFVGK